MLRRQDRELSRAVTSSLLLPLAFCLSYLLRPAGPRDDSYAASIPLGRAHPARHSFA